MPFQNLQKFCKVVHKGMERIDDLEEKRISIEIYLTDLDRLIEDWKRAHNSGVLSSPNSDVKIIDVTPRYRLGAVCEALANAVYGMAAIAGQIGNKQSGTLPSSFRVFCNKLNEGKYDHLNCKEWLNDTSWYLTIRDIRSEWVHYSSIFIGSDKNDEPILVIKPYRGTDDVSKGKAQQKEISIKDFKEAIQKSIHTIDNFLDFIVVTYLIPKLDLNQEIRLPPVDENGFYLIKDGKFVIDGWQTITMEQHILNSGYPALKS